TAFVPESYRLNSAAVRLAVLQGLLDSDGGPVVQRGRTCRIQYTTCSARLRDDVVFLVRSLGGVAYRHDAYALDIRLPGGLQPFRLGPSVPRTSSTVAGDRCASSRRSSRRGRRRPSASRWRRRTPSTSPTT